MARLIDAIPDGAIVALDTMVFIYHIEASSTYADVVGPVFERLARGDFRAVTSVITLLEIVVRPLQLGRARVADEYELLLTNYPNLIIVDVHRQIARRAAEIRARERRPVADSLQVATAVESGATVFVTNDRDLVKLSDITALIVDDFSSSG